jgi:glutathione S-transferase
MSESLIIHGVTGSQPARSVYWTCLIKGLPFELRPVDLASPEARGLLLELNPTGQVPTIEDGGFVLYEMPAILTYLCEKHGWADLLPTDLRTRSRINQYLHFHHNSTRRLSAELMAPHVIVAILDQLGDSDYLSDIVERAHAPDKLAIGRRTAQHVAELIETGYFRNGHRFLCTGEPTIADLACYEELAQLRWADLYDFEGFPKLRAWLDEMQALPFHDEAHLYNTTLGDIRSEPNTVERMASAMGASLSALVGLASAGVRVRG